MMSRRAAATSSARPRSERCGRRESFESGGARRVADVAAAAVVEVGGTKWAGVRGKVSGERRAMGTWKVERAAGTDLWR